MDLHELGMFSRIHQKFNLAASKKSEKNLLIENFGVLINTY